MTRTEERLADALNAAANTVRADALRPLAAPDTKRLRGARRAPWRHHAWLIPVAAAVAVTAVSFASVVAVRSARRAPSTEPAGRPPYYVTYRHMVCCGSGPVGNMIEVRSTATGRVRDTLNLSKRLGMLLSGEDGTGLTAAADRHTFFVSVFSGSVRQPVEHVYRFYVTATGHITALTPLRGVPETGFRASAMAASPDGSRLAMGGALMPDTRTALMIVDVASGARTVWTGGKLLSPAGGIIGSLSWTADGRTLAFTSLFSRDGTRLDATAVRTVEATGHGGSLAGSRRVLYQKASPTHLTIDAIISPDGRRLDLLTLVGKPAPQSQLPGTVRVEEVSVPPATHPGLRYLYVGKAGNSSGPYLRSDGLGHLLLAVDWKLGWLDHGHLHPLPPGDDGTVMDYAW